MPDPTDGIVYHKDNYVSGTPKVEFPATYGIKERDAFNRWISHHGGSHGFGGASGYDAPIIALDAILGTNSWEEVCEWSMLHGGDTSATGVIAGAWYGALNGFQGVPKNHYEDIEFAQKWSDCAHAVFR